MLKTEFCPPAELIQTPDECRRFLEEYANLPIAAVDTETTGLSRPNDYAVFWSISEGNRRWCLTRGTLFYFKKYLEDPHRELIFHNCNFDGWMLKNTGVDLLASCPRTHYRRYDTQVMHALWMDNLPHTLKDIAGDDTILGIHMPTFRETFKSAEKNSGVMLLQSFEEDPSVVVEYASLDAWATYKVWEVLCEKLSNIPSKYGSMLDYYHTLEMPMHDILWRMELEGALIDVPYLEKRIPEIQEEQDKIKFEVSKILGKVVNINSSKQMLDIFYVKGTEGWVDRKTGEKPPVMTSGGSSGVAKPSVNEKVLEQRAKTGCEISVLLMKNRTLEKIRGTYMEGFIKRADSNHRIHTSFNQHSVRTGRLSCLAPWAKVLTDAGYMPMRCVREGDLVLSHTGEWQEVERQFPTGERHVYAVKLSNGEVLPCTTNHQLYTSSGTWVTVQEIMDECFEDVGEQAREREGRPGSVQDRESAANYERDCGGTQHDISQRTAHHQTEHPRSGIEGAESCAVFGLENREQESNEGEGRSEPPQMEGGMRGRVRVPDVHLQEPSSIHSPVGDGPGTWDGALGTSGEDGCSPHRRGPDQQRPGQSRSRNQERPHEHSLLAGEGLAVVRVEAIDYIGSCEVYDLTVEEDHSYLSAGVFSHNSSDPNMQNIPRPDNDVYGLRRHIVAPEGKMLVVSDYGQLEVRIVASHANEERMIEAIWDGRDLHSWNTKVMFGLDYDEILAATVAKDTKQELTDEQKFLLKKRGHGKQVQFGIIYGEGPRKLSEQLKVNLETAKGLLESYFKGYRNIESYLNTVKGFCTKYGYVTTALGRRRQLPEAFSPYGSNRNSALRAAGNMPIQGHAAEIVKAAQIRLFEDPYLWDSGVRQILQIHDEIVAEIPEELHKDDEFEARWLAHLSKPFGEKDALKVPLATDISYGKNWAEAK